MTHQTPSAREAQAQFGRQAARYAGSAVHSGGETLDAVERYASMERYAVALDLGCGS